MLPIMDWIFGTHYLPRKQWPSAYGINEKLPSSLAGQLVYPLRVKSPQTSSRSPLPLTGKPPAKPTPVHDPLSADGKPRRSRATSATTESQSPGCG